ncbi:MAG: hypothetical protein RBS02_14355 [Steroidobacteraceae bacterium]|jgi:hypothetical protein|nr:hypothetical protein [Steroidobacteraceae bacterium]
MRYIENQPTSERADPGVVSVAAWCLLCLYLFVDAVSGAMLSQTGGVAPLSQLWKGLILLLIFLWCSMVSMRLSIAVLALMALLLAGPLFRFVTSGLPDGLQRDCTAAIKALIPALVLIFCEAGRVHEPAIYRSWAPRLLWFSAAAMALNLGLGLLGFGYTSYGSPESGGIGAIGFFYAGNEVGAAYVVLSAFVLITMWNRARSLYLPVAAMLVVAGFVIATKSAILGALTLAFGVPVVSTRGRLWLLGWKGGVLLSAACVALVWAVMEVWSVLKLAGLAERLSSVFAQRGWIGVIFSGREKFVADSIQALWERSTPVEALFGTGQHTLALWSGKLSTETDPIDMYLWFGLPGVAYCAVLYVCYLYIPWRACADRTNHAAPAILLTNMVLVVLSIVGGHVVLSGMVGIVWAALTSLALGGVSVAAAGRGRAPVLRTTS